MNKLEKSLKSWVTNGFISQAQADRIYQFETTNTQFSWIIYSILILGILIIGLGIVSVIAANWYQIPDSIKLIIDFSLLSILALLILRSSQLNKEIQFEILLLLFIVLCLASIGLINQIYHTGGEFYQALLLWSIITLPPVMMARYDIVPWIWLGGFLVGLIFSIYDSIYFKTIFNLNFTAVQMMVPLFCGSMALFSKRFTTTTTLMFAFQNWFYISGIIAIIIADQNDFLTGTKASIWMSYIPGDILSLIACFAIIIDYEYTKIQKILLLLTLLFYVIAFHLPIFINSDFAHAALTIFILGFIAVFTASLHKRKLFQFLLFCIGFRFLCLYFQALGGLALTGLGLIISGLVIISMAILWNKYRNAITVWAERWIQ